MTELHPLHINEHDYIFWIVLFLLQAVEAALNAAAMRRAKALQGLPAAPPLPKRKKDCVSKDFQISYRCYIYI